MLIARHSVQGLKIQISKRDMVGWKESQAASRRVTEQSSSEIEQSLPKKD